MNDKINQMKQALKELVEGVINSGIEITDQMRNMIAQAMEHVANRIKILRSEEKNEIPPIESVIQDQAEEVAQITQQEPEEPEAPPPNEPVPPLDPAPHESSNINSFKYNPKTQQLYVKFQDKFPGQNGPIYAYEGIPKNIYEVFRRGAVVPKTSGSNAWHTWKEGVAPSHGASMYALIRNGGYSYRRIQ